jgi:hypothetical protein
VHGRARRCASLSAIRTSRGCALRRPVLAVALAVVVLAPGAGAAEEAANGQVLD